MNEELLYFVWKFGLYQELWTKGNDASLIEVIYPGEQNSNSGPDFIGAKLKVGDTTWVGNVEIHTKSSDWYKHNHHLNKAYNNVILQVVANHDKEIEVEDGRSVPTVELTIDKNIELKYTQFFLSKTWIPCENDIQFVDDFKQKMWLGKVMIERLNEKSEFIKNSLSQNKNDWEETFYQLLARSFGFKLNAEPFEWLAKSLALNKLAKHQNNLFQLEALFYGQAGFLDSTGCVDEYFINLKKEYNFLKSKFNLVPIEKHLWKFLRSRPSNFPTIRISQFAALIFNSKSLFSKILKCKHIDELKQIFNVEASSFWNSHYTFEKGSIIRKKVLGEQSINGILINTIIPILFVYGQSVNNDTIKERSLNFLEKIKPESNRIIKSWKQIGVDVPSAFYSQALLQQKNYYCIKRKCLSCGIGMEILKKQIV